MYITPEVQYKFNFDGNLMFDSKPCFFIIKPSEELKERGKIIILITFCGITQPCPEHQAERYQKEIVNASKSDEEGSKTIF